MENNLQCSCRNEKYENCPEKVEWVVNMGDEEVFLCDRCYRNAKDGVYGENMKPIVEINLKDFLKNINRRVPTPEELEKRHGRMSERDFNRNVRAVSRKFWIR